MSLSWLLSEYTLVNHVVDLVNHLRPFLRENLFEEKLDGIYRETLIATQEELFQFVTLFVFR
jgi:hypothetical protein